MRCVVGAGTGHGRQIERLKDVLRSRESLVIGVNNLRCAPVSVARDICLMELIRRDLNDLRLWIDNLNLGRLLMRPVSICYVDRRAQIDRLWGDGVLRCVYFLYLIQQ